MDEVLKAMRFWLDMGVDGLRLDAIPYIIERDGTSCENLPETHAKIKQILLASKLATARAWELKEAFGHFWKYKSPLWAGAFLDVWCQRAQRSRLEPMQKVARMLRSHEELLMNCFRAKGEISSGAVEGLNNKIRVVTRRSYGFRTYKATKIALYHTLGRLPERESAHKYC
jgi:transposase